MINYYVVGDYTFYRRGLTLFVTVVLLWSGCGNQPSVPYRAGNRYLEVKLGDEYVPIYVKGVNLGVGIPGTEPGEVALTFDTYMRWLERMNELGVNVVRVYTLHFPRFYEAVFQYNNFHPHKPIYIIHGVWLDEDNPSGGFDVLDFDKDFTKHIGEVVDAVHGNATIPHQLGKAFGDFTVDISPWILAWVIGREVYGGEALAANQSHSHWTSYDGDALSLPSGNPYEVWSTKVLDHLITYERDHYNTMRPVAMSSWPTTDPLYHETEPHFFDGYDDFESIWDAGEDDVTLDLGNIDTTNAPAGTFVSYHNYPYYPNFINREPDYAYTNDHIGPNNYWGYTQELKAHYPNTPLLVSEFGLPSSWGNAHDSPVSGMNHGGHNEYQAGLGNDRMMQNLYDAGTAGGMVFSWMDEWWKRTWIVEHRTHPRHRLNLWFDIVSPEENYGLIAFDPPVPDYSEWAAQATTGTGRIQQVAADMDAAYFHVKIELASPLTDGEEVVIGYDTYRDDLGESILPNGKSTTQRSEFALTITAPDQAVLRVTRDYDLFGQQNKFAEPYQVSQSTASDGNPWMPWRWVISVEATSDDEQFQFPRRDYEMGILRVRDGAPTSLDSVTLDGNTIHVRIPWTLLQYADPSTRSVIHDDLETELIHEVWVSEGVRVAASLGDDLVETPRYQWETWDEVDSCESVPTQRQCYVEREKPSLQMYSDIINALPTYPTSE